MDSTVAAQTLFGKQTTSSKTSEDEERARKHQHHLRNATWQALLIQQRKDVETQILDTIEALTELPGEAIASSVECQQFAKSAAIFQPSDYDDLITERVAQSRCGYTLCLQKPGTTIKTWNATPDTGRFCSNHCRSLSAIIRVQLSPLPAWERSTIVRVVLPQEASPVPHIAAKDDANAELAFERGERATSRKPELVMSPGVVEKAVHAVAVPPERTTDTIEGYTPRQTLAQASNEVKSIDQAISLPMPLSEPLIDEEEQQWNEMFEHLRGKTAR